jgi:hypothetical protein
MSVGKSLEPVEQRLCRRIAAALREAVPDAAVEGNWLAETSGLVKGGAKMAERGARFDVDVSPRGYETYSGVVAEMRVDVEGVFSAAFDADLGRSVAAYAAVAALLGLWHRDLRAAKSALADEGFAVTGMRLDQGEWEIDRETRERRYSQSFYVRGVISGTETERNSEQ